MPKELFEIKAFNRGTISSPSEEDIPPEAAAHSINIDPSATDGMLQAVKEDIANPGAITAGNGGDNSLEFIGDTLVSYKFVSSGSGKIRATDDYKTSNLTDKATIGGTEVSSMVKNNQEIHLGVGKDHPAKWIGYTNHNQFGHKENNLLVDNGKIERPSLFATAHKLCETTSHVFAIKWKGSRIYKFDKTSKSMTSSPKGHRFSKTTAVCLGGGTATLAHQDGNHLWVVDGARVTGEIGRLYKISTSDLTILENHPIATFDFKCREYKAVGAFSSSPGTLIPSIDMEISDILCTNNRLWFSAFSDKYDDDADSTGLTPEAVNQSTYWDIDSFPLLSVSLNGTGNISTEATSTLTFTAASHNSHPIYQNLNSNSIDISSVSENDSSILGKYVGGTGESGISSLNEVSKHIQLFKSKLCLVPTKASDEIAFICRENKFAGEGCYLFCNRPTANFAFGASNIDNKSIAWLVNEAWAGTDQIDDSNHSRVFPLVVGDGSTAGTNNPFYDDQNWYRWEDGSGNYVVGQGTDSLVTKANPIYLNSWGLAANTQQEMTGVTQDEDYTYFSTVGDWPGGVSNADNLAAKKIFRMPRIESIATYKAMLVAIKYLSTGNATTLQDWIHGNSSYTSGHSIDAYGNAGFICSIWGLYLNNEDSGGHGGDEDHFALDPDTYSRIVSSHRKVTANAAVSRYIISACMNQEDNIVNVMEGSGTGGWFQYSKDSDMFDTFSKFTSPAVEIDIDATSEANTAFGTKNYRYACSYTYDGYQEGPLGEPEEATATALNNKNRKITLKVGAIDSSGTHIINRKRATHINLYRCEQMSEITGVDLDNFSLYRLIESIPLDSRWSTGSETSGGITVYTKTTSLVDKYVVGATYDSIVGMSERIEDSSLNYSISTEINSTLFVTNATNDELEYNPTYVYKSLPYKYNSFDWTRDFLAMPEVLTALVGFKGRVYGFSENNTYRIDPNNMYIEDTLEGIGCSSQESVVVTDYGMCFANRSHVYFMEGTIPQPISTPIDQSEHGRFGYQEQCSMIPTGYNPVVTFDQNKTSFIIHCNFAYEESNIYFEETINNLVTDCKFWNNVTPTKFHVGEHLTVTQPGISFSPSDDGRCKNPSHDLTSNPHKSYFMIHDVAWASHSANSSSGSIKAKPYAWAYNLTSRRWDMWESYEKIKAAVTTPDGYNFISSKESNNIIHYLGSTSSRFWAWASKKINMGQSTTVKKVMNANVKYLQKIPDAYRADIYESHALEGTTPNLLSKLTAETSSASDFNIKRFNIREKLYNFQLFLTSNLAGHSTIESIGVIYRRFITGAKK